MFNTFLRHRFNIISLLLISVGFLYAASCTTQDFEYAGSVKTVYRAQLENIGNDTVVYSKQTTIFYINGYDSSAVEDSLVIAPDDPPQLISQSESGAYGISANVFPKIPRSKMRLTLEKGTGRGDQFQPDTLVKVSTGRYGLNVRDGEVYNTGDN